MLIRLRISHSFPIPISRNAGHIVFLAIQGGNFFSVMSLLELSAYSWPLARLLVGDPLFCSVHAVGGCGEEEEEKVAASFFLGRGDKNENCVRYWSTKKGTWMTDLQKTASISMEKLI